MFNDLGILYSLYLYILAVVSYAQRTAEIRRITFYDVDQVGALVLFICCF